MSTKENTHTCGGRIVTSCLQGKTYRYCEACEAFTFAHIVPPGTAKRKNIEAWNRHEHSSEIIDA